MSLQDLTYSDLSYAAHPLLKGHAMRSVFSLILIVGIILAGVGVYVVQNYVSGYQAVYNRAVEIANTRTEVKVVDVFVANRDLRFGEEIKPEDVRMIKWPAEALPEGVFTSENPMYKEGEEPRVALRAIDTNEAILLAKVTEPGATAGLISQIEPGMRGFAILVDPITGVAGFLRPHDRVDIFWTATPSVTENNEKVFSITRQIESGVKIIAVDQNYSVDDADKPQLASTIIVAVTAEQAASLTLAQAQGQLSMTLIGVDETDSMNAEMVEVSQHRLLGISRDEAESAVCHIKSRRGADVVMTEIPCTN